MERTLTNQHDYSKDLQQELQPTLKPGIRSVSIPRNSQCGNCPLNDRQESQAYTGQTHVQRVGEESNDNRDSPKTIRQTR